MSEIPIDSPSLVDDDLRLASQLAVGDEVLKVEAHPLITGAVTAFRVSPSGSVSMTIGGRRYVGIAPYWQVTVK